MRTKLAIIGAAVCLARAAFAVTMASQPWTTNRIAEAEARVAVKITAATNAIPAPDFSQNNAQLRETIVAVSPPADLTEATNHTRAALSAFAGTGTVERARSYGTPTRWTDATGGVWEVVFPHFTDWIFSGVPSGYSFYLSEYNGELPGWNWALERDGGGDYEHNDYFSEEGTETTLNIQTAHGTVTCTREWIDAGTNYVGRVALTNDIPATLPESDPTVPSWAKAGTKPSYSWNEITGKPQVVDETGAAAIAETVVREKSLGGIWDTQLEVWWTPVMRNGALTYQANAVQNAADALAAVSNVVASGGLASVDAVDAKISTNNAAFVSAVTNCPVVIASTNRVGGVKVDGTSVTITEGAISSHVDPLNKMWEFRLSDGGGATANVVGRIIGVSDNTALVYCQLKDTSDIEWSSYISYYLFSMIIDFNSDAYTAISGVTDGSTFAGVIATLYFADAYTIMNGDKPSTTEIEYNTVVFKDVATSN